MDFMGITYKGHHSSEFGLTRVSNGDRYQETLVPNSSIYTTEVPGGDGVYYFGKNLREKVFNLEFAFDSVTETQLRDMKNWLAADGLGDLVFDELPYKRWVCIVSNMPEINYICFDEKNKNGQYERRYKGEVSIEFTSYYPYAFNNYGKCLKDYEYGTINNLSYEGELSEEYQFGTNKANAIALDTGKFYSVAKLGNYPRQDVTNNDYEYGNIEDALKNGENIWNSMEKVTYAGTSLALEDETKIVEGYELLRHLSFIGRNSQREPNKKPQNYYLSCEITLDAKEIMQNPIGWDPMLPNNDGVLWTPITNSSGTNFIPKMGLYIKVKNDGLNHTAYYPLLTWDLEDKQTLGFPNQINGKWNTDSFMYKLLTGETIKLELDTSILVSGSFPDLERRQGELAEHKYGLYSNTGNDRIITSSAFNSISAFLTKINNKEEVNVELVGFGVPYYLAGTGVIVYKQISVKNIKIVEVLDSNKQNAMGTNRTRPYSGGYNYTYFINSDGTKEMSSVYNINREINRYYLRSKTYSNYYHAFTKNIMRIIDDFNPYNSLNANFDVKKQVFIFKNTITDEEDTKTTKTIQIPYNIPSQLYEAAKSTDNSELHFSIVLLNNTEDEPEVELKYTISAPGLTEPITGEGQINSENSIISCSAQIPLWGYIKIDVTGTTTNGTPIKIGLYYGTDSISTPDEWIGYSQLDVVPSQRQNSAVFYNNGITDFVNKTFQYNKEYILAYTHYLDKWLFNLTDDGEYICAILPIEDLDINYRINCNYFYFISGDEPIKHGTCTVSTYENDGTLYPCVKFYIKKPLNTNLEESQTLFKKYLAEFKKTYGNYDEDILKINYVSSSSYKKEVPELVKPPLINGNYYYFSSNTPTIFTLSSWESETYDTEEWASSSKLPKYNEDYLIAQNLLNLPNYGDIETDWKIRIQKGSQANFDFKFIDKTTTEEFGISFLYTDDLSIEELDFYNSKGIIEIDTSKSSILFIKENSSNPIPIHYVLSTGQLFKLKPNSQNLIKITGGFDEDGDNVINSDNLADYIENIEYNYLYY